MHTRPENSDAHHNLIDKRADASKQPLPDIIPLEAEVDGHQLGKLWSFSRITRGIVDLLNGVFAVLFLTYGLVVLRYEGTPASDYPVPTLRTTSRVGTTIFPIVFAALIAQSLRHIAAWRLEHGVTVLSLEYLLGSRTVASAILTPLSLRAVNWISLAVILTWAFSPLGGQAVLKVVAIEPAETTSTQNVTYLDFLSPWADGDGIQGSAAPRVLPAVEGAFLASLASPAGSKRASQDVFGNPKIPMLEVLSRTGAAAGADGWYDLQGREDTVWTSIIGMPFLNQGKPIVKTAQAYNMSLETAYTYATCNLSHMSLEADSNNNLTMWSEWISQSSGPTTYSNGRTFAINLDQTPAIVRLGDNASSPLAVNLTSITYSAVTNATCQLSTTYVEARVFCKDGLCDTTAIRQSQRKHNDTNITVFDGLGGQYSEYNGRFTPSGLTGQNFFQTFVNASSTPWDSLWGSGSLHSSPMEYYFTNPDVPFSMPLNESTGFSGADIYLVGDDLFSQRFSQLLNTYWISGIAPFGVTGDLAPPNGANATYSLSNTSAVVSTQHDALVCNRAWLAILIIASILMLVACVAGMVFAAMRKGPDILDRPTSLLRENAYVPLPYRSTEDAHDQARRWKDVQLLLGDVESEKEVGRIAVGMPSITSMTTLRSTRLYR